MAFIIDDAILAAIAATTTTAATTAPAATATASAAAAGAGAGTVSANLAAIGTVASVGGAVGQGVLGSIAAKAQGKALEVSKRKQKIQLARERRRIVRESQAARASIVSQAESQGVGGGSTAVQGAIQSVEAQGRQETSFLQQQERLGDVGSEFLNRANRFQTASNLFGTFTNVTQQSIDRSLFLRRRG